MRWPWMVLNRAHQNAPGFEHGVALTPQYRRTSRRGCFSYLPLAWLTLLLALLSPAAAWAQAPTAMEPVNAQAPTRDDQQVLVDYAARLPHLREQIPAIVEAAEAAAARVAAHPETRLLLPGGRERSWFSNEFMSRAGGLANAWYRVERRQPFRAGDVILVAPDAWANADESFATELAEYKDGGAIVILFASKADLPEGIAYDFLIDNGAASGDAAHRPVNVIASVTLGWMWTCEYAAALSRLGKAPGILWTKAHVEGIAHNEPLQTDEGRIWLGETDMAVAPRVLSHQYLEYVMRLIEKLRSSAFQAQLDNAADLIARRLAEGKTVWLSGTGHAVPHDMNMEDGVAPWTHVYRSAMPRRSRRDLFKKGQLFVWIGYMGYVGLKRGGVDFIDHFEERGVDMIISEAAPPARDSKPEVAWDIFREDPQPGTVVATLDQFWGLPDAEVTVPWAPGFMAPISGINGLLLYRMLDAEVAARVEAPAVSPVAK